MRLIGRGLQLVGIGMAGYAAIRGFSEEVSEGFFLSLGFGGYAVFYVGTLLLRRGA